MTHWGGRTAPLALSKRASASREGVGSPAVLQRFCHPAVAPHCSCPHRHGTFYMDGEVHGREGVIEQGDRSLDSRNCFCVAMLRKKSLGASRQQGCSQFQPIGFPPQIIYKRTAVHFAVLCFASDSETRQAYLLVTAPSKIIMLSHPGQHTQPLTCMRGVKGSLPAEHSCSMKKAKSGWLTS